MEDTLRSLQKLKDAGLSYQPLLVVPFKDVVACKDDESLRVLQSIYAIDMYYAAVFGKKRQYLDTRRFIDTEIELRLPVNDDALEPVDPAVVRAFVQDLENLNKRDALLAAMGKRAEQLFKMAETDPASLDHIVDAFYGFLLEGTYLAFSLARDEKISPELTALFKSGINRISRRPFHSFEC